MTDPIGSEPFRHPLGRRRFMAALASGLLAAPLAAQAQQAGKVYRIGVLLASDSPTLNVEAFRQELRKLGYVEGRKSVGNFSTLGRRAPHPRIFSP